MTIDGILPYLDEKNISRYIVVLDCCRSGAALKSPGVKNRGEEISSQDLQSISGQGKIFIASSRDYQLSHELKDLKQGLFSYYFVRGIETGEAVEKTKRFIGIVDLSHYIQRQIRDNYPEYSQHPTLSGTDQSGSLLIAHNPKYQPPIANSPKDIGTLMRDCSRQVEHEIEEVVGDKYISDLYVQRRANNELQAFVENRFEKISDNLSSLLSSVNSEKGVRVEQRDNLANSIRDENSDFSEEDIIELEKCKEKLELLNQLSTIIKATISSHAKNPSSIKTLRNYLNQISSHKGSSQKIKDRVSNIHFLLRNVMIITSAAGRGKTNLACSMATAYGKRQPTVFISASVIPLTTKYSLEKYLQQSLGYPEQLSSQKFIKIILKILRENNQELIVVIDAINEAQNIQVFRKNINAILRRYKDENIKFIFTCRDIYWNGFMFQPGDFWNDYIFSQLSLEQFTDDELTQALKLYFTTYQIFVTLSDEARERLKQPLLLRFFCEAHRQAGQTINLGMVNDIRIRPLFDLYWLKKVANVQLKLSHRTSKTVEDVLLRIASAMRIKQKTALSFYQMKKATRLADYDSFHSPYTAILDERIILERIPTSQKRSAPHVGFVYEEFMEYVIAREFTMHLANIKDSSQRIQNIKSFLSTVDDFPNVYGIISYLVPMLDESLEFSIWSFMYKQGSRWREPLARALTRANLDKLSASAYLFAEKILRAEKNPEIMMEFVENVWQNKPNHALRYLELLLQKENPSLRLHSRNILVSMARDGNNAAEHILRESLAHSSETVRATALYALAELRRVPSSELPYLLKDEDKFVREAAIYSVGRLEKPSDSKIFVKHIIKGLLSKSPAIQFVATIVGRKPTIRPLISGKALIKLKENLKSRKFRRK